MPKTRSPGFTLAELTMVLLIAGLLAAFALPTLRESILRKHLRVAIEALNADLGRARLHAVSTGKAVDLFANDGIRGWAGGWKAAQDGQIVFGMGHPSLHPALRSGRRQHPTLRFDPLGAAQPPHTITLCVRKRPATAYSVVISLAGRVRLAPAEGARARDCAW